MVLKYAKEHNWSNFMKWPRWAQDIVLVSAFCLFVFSGVAQVITYTRATEARDTISKEALESDQRFCSALPTVIAEALTPFNLPPSLLNEVLLRTSTVLQNKGACPPGR